jgi:hypothetical protein
MTVAARRGNATARWLLPAAAICAQCALAPVAAAQSPEAAPSSAYGGFSVGAGVGQRVIEYGSSAGIRALDTGLVPVVHLRLFAGVASSRSSFGGQLEYRSSLGADAQQRAPDTTGSTTPMRTHVFQLGMLPEYRFSDAAQSSSLAVLIGYGLRALASDAELLIPRYTLHGPLLRPVLHVALGALSLRFALEAQLVASISHDLRVAGNLDPSGFALGGEAALGVRAAQWLVIEASYREAHALVGSFWATSFSDIERFVTLDATAQLF